MLSVVLVTQVTNNQADTVVATTVQAHHQLEPRVQLALQLLVHLNQFQLLRLNQLNQLVIVRNQHHLHTNLNPLKLATVHLVRRQVAHHQALKLHTEGNNQCSEIS